MITKLITLTVGGALLATGLATHATAQTVADTLTFLMTNQSVDTGSMARDQAAAQAASRTISRAVLTSLATLPISTSSGSFAYRLNPDLGTVERADQTFGPFFVERALTAGRRQLSGGVAFQHLAFTSLDGHNLKDGTLITTANQFTDESAPFDVDRLQLNISADVATVYGNLGITERLEIGAALPVTALRVDGTRTNTYRGQTVEQARASATAVGVADAVVRAKYLWANDGAARLATAIDVRLPTGREQDLLGAGSRSVKVSGIGSLGEGRLSAHANLGVSFGGIARELSYGGALTAAASSKLALTEELVGRWVNDVGSITTTTTPNPLLSGVQTIRLSSDTSDLNLMNLVSGIKWNLSGTWVVLANVSIPLTHQGLTAPVTPFVGIDCALGSIF